MVTALAQLRDASSKSLDEPQIDLYGEGGEGEEETANSQDEECEEAAGSQDGEHDDGHACRPAKLASAKGRNGARPPSHAVRRFPVNVLRNTGYTSSPEFNPYCP